MSPHIKNQRLTQKLEVKKLIRACEHVSNIILSFLQADNKLNNIISISAVEQSRGGHVRGRVPCHGAQDERDCGVEAAQDGEGERGLSHHLVA